MRILADANWIYPNTHSRQSHCGCASPGLTLSNSVGYESAMTINIGRGRSVSKLIRLLCGFHVGPLEDLPVMPVDVHQFDHRLTWPGREQRLAGQVVHRPPSVA